MLSSYFMAKPNFCDYIYHIYCMKFKYLLLYIGIGGKIMKKKNILFVITTVSIATLLTTGCGKEAKLKNGEEKAVSFKNSTISVDNYYNEIKTENISKLVDMIDHKLFDKKYKTDDKEKESIETQIKQIKSYYTTDETFQNAISQYFGVSSEDELKEVLSLEYKRNLAVTDYVKSTITDKEIKDYYNDNITGDMKASHILIKSSAKDDATDEEKEKAEKKALEKAKKIIKKLDEGKDFAELAKKYSEDTATAEKGGDLGYFSADEMDENFSNATKELKENEYSKTPVKSQYGYHIILKTGQKQKPTLKSSKKKIIETLATNKVDSDSSLHYQALVEIREKAKIKFNDDKLKKAYDDLMDKLIKNASSSSSNTTQN